MYGITLTVRGVNKFFQLSVEFHKEAVNNAGLQHAAGIIFILIKGFLSLIPTHWSVKFSQF